MHRATARTMIAVGGLLLAGACGSDDETSGATDADPKTNAATLVIKDFSYGSVQGARARQPIRVDNQDGFAHTVTADDDSFDVEIAANGTATLTIDAAGTYTFHCTIHPSMSGTVTVG